MIEQNRPLAGAPQQLAHHADRQMDPQCVHLRHGCEVADLRRPAFTAGAASGSGMRQCDKRGSKSLPGSRIDAICGRRDFFAERPRQACPPAGPAASLSEAGRAAMVLSATCSGFCKRANIGARSASAQRTARTARSRSPGCRSAGRRHRRQAGGQSLRGDVRCERRSSDARSARAQADCSGSGGWSSAGLRSQMLGGGDFTAGGASSRSWRMPVSPPGLLTYRRRVFAWPTLGRVVVAVSFNRMVAVCVGGRIPVEFIRRVVAKRLKRLVDKQARHTALCRWGRRLRRAG